MTDKKKAKAEVEGLVVKIGVDAVGVADAIKELRELADAANAAREALDRLMGLRPSSVATSARGIVFKAQGAGGIPPFDQSGLE